MEQRNKGMQRNKEKEGMGNRKKYKKCSRKIKQLRFTNDFINIFLKVAVMKMKAMLTSALLRTQSNV